MQRRHPAQQRRLTLALLACCFSVVRVVPAPQVQVRIEIVKLNKGDEPVPDVEDIPLDVTAAHLDLTNLRATSLPSLAAMRSLQRLVLRQNWLTSFSYVSAGCPHLTELDLYENKINTIARPEDVAQQQQEAHEEAHEDEHADAADAAAPAAAAAAPADGAPAAAAAAAPAPPAPRGCIFPPDLVVLDLSFNEIRRIENVSHLSHLRDLYFVSNRIKRIQGLEGLSKLRLLELGSNALRSIDGAALQAVPNLEELWLGRNKIAVIDGLDHLSKLRKLSIQSNRLTEIGSGLQRLTSLRELYLSHNGLTGSPLGLSSLINLTTLDLAGNQLTTLDGSGLEALRALEELWLNNNALEWAGVTAVFRALAGSLQTIYLEHNPLQKEQSPAEYVAKVRAMVPKLAQLDAHYF